MVLENGDECDLKSIMNVFAISTISQGESLKIVCDGADEDLAVAGFKKLASEYSF
jgi:phosphotransferase system HPr-like phosphotransfer protein